MRLMIDDDDLVLNQMLGGNFKLIILALGRVYKKN